MANTIYWWTILADSLAKICNTFIIIGIPAHFRAHTNFQTKTDIIKNKIIPGLK